MSPQGPGMVGGLPLPAWRSLRDPDATWFEGPAKAWRATVRELRRTCKALAELVGAGCVGSGGWLNVDRADKAVQLEAAATAGLGRALEVSVRMPLKLGQPPQLEVQEAMARAVAVAVERNHMIWFESVDYKCAPAVARMIEATLIEASRKGLLLDADLGKGEPFGWSIDAMAQLSSVGLYLPERETVATLAGAGALRRIELCVEWADVSILSSLRKVKLGGCHRIRDVSPLADVPLLMIEECDGIQALPAMRNDVLKVSACHELNDLSGLAGGRVGRLELQGLSEVEDLSAIWAMQPPPRSVVLDGLDEEQAENVMENVSMLAGINRLELFSCCFDEDAVKTLEDMVGTLIWEEE